MRPFARKIHGFASTEYAAVLAILIAATIAFAVVSSGILRGGLDATETDLARPDSLDAMVGVVEVEPVARDLALLPGDPPPAITDVPFAFAFADRLRLPPEVALEDLTWSLAGDPLPVGFVFDTATGALSGMYTATATVPLVLEVTVSDGVDTVTATYGWQLRDFGMFLAAAVPPVAVYDVPYTFDLRPLADRPPGVSEGDLTWSVVSGALPDGLAFSPSSATIMGTFLGFEGVALPLTVQASGGGFVAQQTYTFEAQGEGLRLLEGVPLAWSAQAPVAFDATTVLQRAPAIDPGSLTWMFVFRDALDEPMGVPAGLSVAGPVVSGTHLGLEDTAWTLDVGVSVGPYGDSRSYEVAYTGRGVVLNEDVLADVRANLFYDTDMTSRLDLASGFDAEDVTWSVVSGSLPSGLGLDVDTGRLSGTHTGLVDFTSSFGVRAALPDGRFSEATFEVDVIGAGAVATPTVLPHARYGVPYVFDLRDTLTTRDPFDFDTLVWTVSGAPLPSGLSVDLDTGLITGTHFAPQDADLSLLVVATDAANVTATAVHTLPVDGLEPFSLSIGAENSCGLTERGAALCWGRYLATNGVLGNPVYTANRTVPSPIDDSVAGQDFVQISQGGTTACAVTRAGAAWCWGVGSSGQMGNGTTTEVNPSPVAVDQTTMGPVSKIDVGAIQVCALSQAAEVWCWGGNTNGRVGNGNTLPQTSPVKVLQNTGMTAPIVDISIGNSQSCALDDGGQMWCWGSGSAGQLGRGYTTATNSSPGLVSSASGLAAPITAISVGNTHTCALDAAGSAWCWGAFANGRLGGVYAANQFSPQLVASGSMGNVGLSDLSAYITSACVIKDGDVWCWGDMTNGRLGNGVTTGTSTEPVQVAGLPVGVAMERLAQGGGATHVCVVADTRQSWCWGAGNRGQLGHGASPTNQASPVATSWPAIAP